MTRPLIVTTQADGTTVEREMDDTEFAEHQATIDSMKDKIKELEAKLQARTNKLANP